MTSSRPASEITLLQVVETRRGRIPGDYRETTEKLHRTCGFHRAMAELHDSVVGSLSRWTLADLAEKPAPSPSLAKTLRCRMTHPA